MIDEDPMLRIGYEKFLKCPKCQDEELYCSEHRAEVEAILYS
jgi:hypothetical protein